MEKIKRLYKKYPCFALGILFSISGFIFTNKELFELAFGHFIGAIIYESGRFDNGK